MAHSQGNDLTKRKWPFLGKLPREVALPHENSPSAGHSLLWGSHAHGIAPRPPPGLPVHSEAHPPAPQSAVKLNMDFQQFEK